MNARPAHPRTLRNRRGSVLIVAMIFSLVIAISLVSFLRISTSASQLSYRTFYQGVAMNIAESGLEQALWEINKASGSWSGWTAVSGATGAYRRSFDLGKVEGGATTTVKVYAQTGSSAYVIARAIVTPPKGLPVEKWIRVTLSRKSRFSVGGLGRDGIVVNGNNVVMGSWNSNPDGDDSTLYVPFSAGVMNDNMALATLNLDASLNSAQGDINGTAAVGGDSLDAIQVGTQGYIGPFGTPVGTKDPNSVSTNFSTDLEVPSAPSKTYTSLGAISSNLTLPRPGDTANADGTYYYSSSQISLTNKILSIEAGKKVVIKVDNNPGGSVSVGGGSGAIQIGSTLTTNTATGAVTYNPAKLEIYTDGDVSIGGQGSANQVVVQNYSPATVIPTDTTTTTTIANVTDVYGKGAQKNTVIGWNYSQTVTTVTKVSGVTTSTTSSGPTTYQALIASGATKPVAGTTSTTSTTSITQPAVTTTTATMAGQPKNFFIYGTRTNTAAASTGMQTFTISGNGNLSAVVYAPNANISAKGGGNSGFLYGSLVGNSLRFTGNDCFYYDESLAADDASGRLGIDTWDEIVSGADKSGKVSAASSQTYASLMNF